jgi:hypothetical protein
LYRRTARALDALAAIAGGVIAVVAAQLWNAGKPIGLVTPAMFGLAAAAVAFALVSSMLIQRRTA